MKTKFNCLFTALALLALSTLNAQLSTAFAQGTAFTYQGQLQNNGTPANGSYDLKFALFSTNVSGVPFAGPVTNTATAVSNGLFTTTIDFGAGVFTGGSNWLEIGVETNGAVGFTTLLPRQQVTPTPYAITAENVIGLTVQQNTNGSPNVIEGSSVNYVSNSVYAATIGGGGTANFSNSVTADFGTVGGGGANTASGWASTVGGGYYNTASSPDGSATVDGGYYNTASGDSATVGGGDANTASGYYATVGGGIQNQVGAAESVIGGGYFNIIQANAFNSTIGGGGFNTIQTNAQFSTIGGGENNNIYKGIGETIGGGEYNTSSNSLSTVGGGYFNTSIGSEATVSGGIVNTSSGDYSTIPGGGYNIAAGRFSFAAGYYAQASHDGAFVWSDESDISGAHFSSTANNQFSVRATGGVRFVTSGAGMTVDGNVGIGTTIPSYPLTAQAPLGADVVSWGNPNGELGRLGVEASGGWMGLENSNVFKVYVSANGTSFFNGGNVGIGTTSPQTSLHLFGTDATQLRLQNSVNNKYWNIYAESYNNSGNLVFTPNSGTGGYINQGDGNYYSLSDRRLKQDITPLDGVLDKVLQLRPVSYHFRSAPEGTPPTLGLIAQEVEPLFPEVVGEHAGMKSLAYSELVPVTIGAIQELNQKVEEKNSEIQNLKQQNDSLEKRLGELETAVKSLEAKN